MNDVQSRFSHAPQNNHMSRSTFNRDYLHKTTFDTSNLIPFHVDEVLPGDTFQVGTTMVVRGTTPLTPVMDDAFLDYWYFYVPSRILWKHFKEFHGENTQGHWVQKTQYQIPQITSPVDDGWIGGTIADYLGIPTKIKGLTINALPFRAIAFIIQEFFRDQNLQDPPLWSLDDATVTGSNGADYVNDVARGGMPFQVGKYHDYFTSGLPAPQKGDPVEIALLAGIQPVITSKDIDTPFNSIPMEMRSSGAPSSGQYKMSYAVADSSDLKKGYVSTSGTTDPLSAPGGLMPSNLGVKLDNAAAITVNDLRSAVQVQRALERDARGGTRYREMLKAHFGVISPDARQQVPEYLGGAHLPLNISQVLQTSATEDGKSPLAETGAYSLTGDQRGSFTKSFTEHGYIIGLLAVRTRQTYQQGLNRMWLRKSRFDFYYPVFANIGEQPVYNAEIYAQGTDVDRQTFNFQEAWADYRFKFNMVTGAMRSNWGTGSLDIWHYANVFSALPVFGSDFIKETKANVQRTLAVQNEPQWFADIQVHNRATRSMPMYSVPGQMDRN